MATPFSSSMSFSSNNHIGKYHREMTALVESKCTSVVGAGVCVIEDTRPSNTKVCTNARAVVVEKQFGSDPTLPGPGQYINPVSEGRDSEGGYKVVLSTQKNIGSVKFSGPNVNISSDHYGDRKQPDTGPGPGQYLNPMTIGRGSDGEAKAIMSNEEAVRNTVWFRPGARRNVYCLGDKTPGPGAYINPLDRNNIEVLSSSKTAPRLKFGLCRRESDATRKPKQLQIARQKDDTPGPGYYIDPMTEGRNSDGEVKALLSNQHTVKTVKFGARPNSAPRYRSQKTKTTPSDQSDVNKASQHLSNNQTAGRTVFAREPYEPSNEKGTSSRKGRPSSAPGARRDTPGFVVLKADFQASSKYKNSGGPRWGPPGR
mmetsp:Transcript_29865/g.38537  ORF Transcript_29865/g.38537 Transcript_29865/m.38537 type:complete len:371 (+) Transcript_29865:62-1174(+)